MFLLDADILIDIQRGHANAVAWYTSLVEVPSVAGYVVMELVQDAQNSKQVKEAMKLVTPLPTLWPTDADCDRALQEYSKFHLSHGIGLLDSLIAATAVGLNAELCTFNVKHYRCVPNLKTIQPYIR